MAENAIWDFEAHSDITKYCCTYKDIMLWPYIRTTLGVLMQEREWGAPVGVYLGKNRHFYKDYIQYNTFRLPKSDIMFEHSSGMLIEVQDELKDRLESYYMDISGKSVADYLRHVQAVDYKKYKRIPYCTDDFIASLIAGEGKRNQISKTDELVIDEMLDYLRNNFPLKLEEGIYKGRIRERLQRVVLEFPAYYKYYTRLMDIVQPKVVFCHAALQGMPEIRVMNDYGVITAEFQHSALDSYNTPYGSAKQIAENEEYRKCMPQYFLTYHDYWTRNLYIPSKIYRVGNPVVEENIRKCDQRDNSFSDANILLIPEFIPQKYKEFITELLEVFPKEYTITIKVHPGCYNDLEGFRTMFDNYRINVTIQGSVYDYICKARYVVGDGSTAMYEAAAVGKSVFVID